MNFSIHCNKFHSTVKGILQYSEMKFTIQLKNVTIQLNKILNKFYYIVKQLYKQMNFTVQ